MSIKNIEKSIFEKHPELLTLLPKQVRLLRKIIEEAVILSSKEETLDRTETEAYFKDLVPDTGKPSAALRAYRKRLDLTQHQLSKKTKIPQPHISAMESGKRQIGLIAAKKLAKALRIDYKKLV